MPGIDINKLEQYADKVYNRANYFNEYTLRTIGRRLKDIGSLSAYDQETLNNIADISGDMEQITKELARVTELNVRDIEKIYTQTVTDGINSYKPLHDFKNIPLVPFKKNEYAQFLVRHWAKQTSEEMINLSRTKALCFTKYNHKGDVIGITPLKGAYQKAIDDAVIAVSTGTTDINTVIRKTVENLGGSGVRVNYGSGVTRRLDTMVRQNLLYGAKKSNQAYDDYISEKLGCNGFEVDYHPNPRKSHAFMGGEVFSYNGRVKINGRVYEDGSEALERLEDHGCLHLKFGMILGVSEPNYSKEKLEEMHRQDMELVEYDGVKKTRYEWKQAQRRLETKVRQEKDISVMAKSAGDNDRARQADDKIKVLRAKYDDLCDKTGLQPTLERTAVPNLKNSNRIVEKGISKKRQNLTKENFVDMAYIQSKEFKTKFDELPFNSKVNKIIYEQSKALLIHRNGTYFEDIYLIDSDSGKVLSKSFNNLSENEVLYSNNAEKIIKENVGKLISIHNHGTNNPPTGSDFVSAGYRKYKNGIVLCHNGDVYLYKSGNIAFSSNSFSKMVDNLMKKGYNEKEAYFETLKYYERKYNIEWRML